MEETQMVSDEVKLPRLESLSVLSGLPEGIMVNDIAEELEKDMVRLGKPDKEAAAAIQKLTEAHAKERDRVVEACYLAGYLKGMTDMAQRFKELLESRGELDRHSGRKT